MTTLSSRPGGQELLRGFKGAVITADSADYGEARRIWNQDADKFPLAVVRPVDTQDIVAAVRFAREADLLVSVRCGGHSYQGHSTCNDGLVIDLSAGMGNVHFDPASNTVRAQGGAMLRAVDRATATAGRVVPAGIVSHTGLSGLALGGGIGYLTPSFGLTCDQFVRLQVVTAAGEVVHASETENPDLFWALRGGGGNFGIVTDFELRTHPLGPVQSGPLLYSMDVAVDVIGAMSDLMRDAPRELSLTFALALKPAMMELIDGFVDGERLLMVNVVYRGGPDDEILRKLRSCRKPLADLIQEEDFVLIQQRVDEVSQHGVGWYMKSGQTKELSVGLIERMVDSAMEFQAVAVPEVAREVYAIQTLGGAASDVAEDATAYSGREAQWQCAIEVGFMTAEERDRVVTWTKQSWAETAKFLDMQTSYVNLNVEEGTSALEGVYGAKKLSRLRDVKATYDPDNLFKLNTNIPPASS